MRVGLLCNQNNIMFSLARHLRDRGVDAEVVLFDNERAGWPHFHPSQDTFDLGYQAFTREVAWGEAQRFGEVSSAKIQRDLAQYDVLIGCGTAPAFVHHANRVLDIFIPFGSDLGELPFSPPGIPLQRLQSMWAFPLAQRAGIRACSYVVGDPSPLIEPQLRRLNFPGERVTVGLPMIYTPLYNAESIRAHCNQSHWAHEMQRFRADHDIVLFHHARHIWKPVHAATSQKRNDKLLRGVKLAMTERPDLKVGIITCDYGPDVSASRQLSAELGIETCLQWLPLASRKELMLGLSLADFGCGEFGESWLSCGTVYEGLAMAKPLLHRREDALYRYAYDELYPMCDVKEAEDVARYVLRYAQDRAPYLRMGVDGAAWHQRYAVDGPVDRIVACAEAAYASRIKSRLVPVAAPGERWLRRLWH